MCKIFHTPPDLVVTPWLTDKTQTLSLSGCFLVFKHKMRLATFGRRIFTSLARKEVVLWCFCDTHVQAFIWFPLGSYT